MAGRGGGAVGVSLDAPAVAASGKLGGLAGTSSVGSCLFSESTWFVESGQRASGIPWPAHSLLKASSACTSRQTKSSSVCYRCAEAWLVVWGSGGRCQDLLSGNRVTVNLTSE